MRADVDRIAASRASAAPTTRCALTRNMRRAIRQAAVIAVENEFHAFRVHTDGSITFTLKHEKAVLSNPEPKSKGDAPRDTREPSKRALRSRDRARAHAELTQRAHAHAFRVRALLR